MRRLRQLALVACALVALGSAAFAGPARVVLLGIGANDPSAGDSPRAAEIAVRQMLEAHFVLMAGEAYKAKAKELGATSASPADVHRVCAAIHADALVAGMLVSSEDTWELRLVLRRCDTGAVVQKYHYPLLSRMVDYDTLKKVESDLTAGIQSAVGGSGSAAPAAVAQANPAGASNGAAAEGGGAGSTAEPGETAEGESEAGGAGGVAENGSQGAQGESPAGASPSDEEPADLADASENPLEEEAGGGEQTSESASPATTVVSHATPDMPRWVDVAAGLVAGVRDFQFTGPTQRQRFAGGMIRGLYVDGTLFPLSGRVGGPLAGLGVGGTLDYVPSYSTNLGGSAGPPIDTSEQSWAVELRWRLGIGDAPHPPQVRAALGYGTREFDMAAHEGVSVPNLIYSFVTVRAGGAVPLLEGRLTLLADLALLPETSVDLGTTHSMYGSASGGLGWSIDGGVDFAVLPDVHVRGDVRYTSLSSTFTTYGPASESHTDVDLLAAFLY